jgi:hypothetical protein
VQQAAAEDGQNTACHHVSSAYSSPRARHVVVTDFAVVVEFLDGRTITAPITWYPRLLHGTPAERNHWWPKDNGEAIYWPELDEHIALEALLHGMRSDESPRSLRRWLDERGG